MRLTKLAVITAALTSAAFAADQAVITVQLDGTTPFAIQTWNFGASNSSTNSTGGGTAGRTSLTDLAVVKQFDGSTTKLFKTAATGARFDKVVLIQRDPATKQAILEILMEGVRVSNFQVAGSTNSLEPVESISFSYDKITITYMGNAGRSSAGFDMKSQKAF